MSAARPPGDALSAVVDALLDEFVGVGAGDRILVLAPPGTSGPLAALEAAARQRGVPLEHADPGPLDPRRGDLPSRLLDRFRNFTVVLDLAGNESLIHAPGVRDRVREGALRVVPVSLENDDDWTGDFARYPLATLFRRAAVLAERLAAGGRSRLAAGNGTDLIIDVAPGSVIGMPGGAVPAPMRPGRGGFGLFPPGAVGTSPAGAEGTVILDGLVGFRGLLAAPVELEIRSGSVSKVSGGPEARWLEREIAERDNGGHVAKVLAGIHPSAPWAEELARLDRRKSVLSRSEGVVLIGLGDSRSVGGAVGSSWHWDGVIMPPVEWDIGGRPLFRAGQAQTLPEVSDFLRPSLYSAGPHRPRLIARAGELALFAAESRGPMPHAHRNPESDEVWIPAGGPPIDALVGEDETPHTVGPGQLIWIPRGSRHRVCGRDAHSPMLVLERIPAAPPAAAEGAGPPPRTIDLDRESGSRTLPWTRSRRPMLTTPSFTLEVYRRPEGMLRPDARVESPELWIVLKGAATIEWEDEDGGRSAPAGSVASLPEGGRARVVSVSQDTIAVRAFVP